MTDWSWIVRYKMIPKNGGDFLNKMNFFETFRENKCVTSWICVKHQVICQKFLVTCHCLTTYIDNTDTLRAIRAKKAGNLVLTNRSPIGHDHLVTDWSMLRWCGFWAHWCWILQVLKTSHSVVFGNIKVWLRPYQQCAFGFGFVLFETLL